jgi:hypothetical protein
MKNVFFQDFTPCGGELGTMLDLTSCHPDDRGAKLSRNVSYYKSHMM